MGILWKHSYLQVEWKELGASVHFSLKRKEGTKNIFCLLTERARYFISLASLVLDHFYYGFLRFKVLFLVQEEIQIVTFFLGKRNYIKKNDFQFVWGLFNQFRCTHVQMLLYVITLFLCKVTLKWNSDQWSRVLLTYIIYTAFLMFPVLKLFYCWCWTTMGFPLTSVMLQIGTAISSRGLGHLIVKRNSWLSEENC